MTDREKLIELLNDMQTEGNKSSYVEWAGCKMKHEVKNEQIADHLIANGVTFAKDNNVPSKWISVKDRLPEDRQKVLCFKKAKYGSCVMTASFSECLEKYCNVDFYGVKHGGFFSYDSEVGYYELREVTHWMPLPEPPKGE